ncbi:hypothetical protein D3C86_1392740 [compost metagenome]
MTDVLEFGEQLLRAVGIALVERDAGHDHVRADQLVRNADPADQRDVDRQQALGLLALVGFIQGLGQQHAGHGVAIGGARRIDRARTHREPQACDGLAQPALRQIDRALRRLGQGEVEAAAVLGLAAARRIDQAKGLVVAPGDHGQVGQHHFQEPAREGGLDGQRHQQFGGQRHRLVDAVGQHHQQGFHRQPVGAHLDVVVGALLQPLEQRGRGPRSARQADSPGVQHLEHRTVGKLPGFKQRIEPAR